MKKIVRNTGRTNTPRLREKATSPDDPRAALGWVRFVDKDDLAALLDAADALREIRDSQESDLGTFSEFAGQVATDALARFDFGDEA